MFREECPESECTSEIGTLPESVFFFVSVECCVLVKIALSSILMDLVVLFWATADRVSAWLCVRVSLFVWLCAAFIGSSHQKGFRFKSVRDLPPHLQDAFCWLTGLPSFFFCSLFAPFVLDAETEGDPEVVKRLAEFLWTKHVPSRRSTRPLKIHPAEGF